MSSVSPMSSSGSGSVENPDVSIVIANWNGENLLGDCIDSIYRETQKVSFEVIVCDDVSTDRSVELLRSKYPHVKLHVNAVNSGFARTNNAALPLVRGRYILLLNNDTILENDAVSVLAQTLDRDPRAGVCGGLLLDRGPSRQHSFGAFPGLGTELGRALGIRRDGPLRWWPNLAQYPATGETKRKVGYIVGADLMIRTDLARKLGLFDEGFEAYFEDTDLCFRVHRAGYDVIFTSDARIIHLVGQSYGNEAVSLNERKLRLMEVGFVRFCRKNYHPWHASLILALRSWALWQKIAWLNLRMSIEPKRRHLRYRDTLKLYQIIHGKFQEACRVSG